MYPIITIPIPVYLFLLMTINNNNVIIANEIAWIRQLYFSHVTFLSLGKVSVKFNISFSHGNFHYRLEVFRINNSYYQNIDKLFMLCYTRNHTYQDSTYNYLNKNPNHLIFYTHTNIHHASIFALNYIPFHSTYIYASELKILFCLPVALYLITFIFIWNKWLLWSS